MFRHALASKRRASLLAFLRLGVISWGRPDAIMDASTEVRRGQWHSAARAFALNPVGRRQTRKYRATVPVPECVAWWLDETTGPLVPQGLSKSTWRRMELALGMPASLDDLAAHDFIGPDRARSDLQLAAKLAPALARERFAIRTDSHPAQLAFARAGLGIAVVQCPIGHSDPLLRPVLADLEVATLDTWIVTHESLRNVPRVRAVFDHLVERFTEFARQA